MKTGLNQIQKLLNGAAIIVTKSRYDAPSKPLFHMLKWKTIEELITDETKIMPFKSPNDFRPQYITKMLTKNWHFTELSLQYTTTDLRLPLRKSAMEQKIITCL